MGRARARPLALGAGEDQPGVVHRLDRDTTGVLVLARTEQAMEALQGRFRARAVEKEYLAVVHGAPHGPAGTVELALEPAPGSRDRQRVARDGAGKDARTDWELVERLGLVPRRQALHARRIDFEHPATGERVAFEAPVPGDLARLVVAARTLRREVLERIASGDVDLAFRPPCGWRGPAGSRLATIPRKRAVAAGIGEHRKDFLLNRRPRRARVGDRYVNLDLDDLRQAIEDVAAFLLDKAGERRKRDAG